MSELWVLVHPGLVDYSYVAESLRGVGYYGVVEAMRHYLITALTGTLLAGNTGSESEYACVVGHSP